VKEEEKEEQRAAVNSKHANEYAEYMQGRHPILCVGFCFFSMYKKKGRDFISHRRDLSIGSPSMYNGKLFKKKGNS
jgi:hypothetical protein